MSTYANDHARPETGEAPRLSEAGARRRMNMLSDLLDEMDTVHRRRRHLRSGAWGIAVIALCGASSFGLANRLALPFTDAAVGRSTSGNSIHDDSSPIGATDAQAEHNTGNQGKSSFRFVKRVAASSGGQPTRLVIKSVSGGESGSMQFIRRMNDDELVSELHRSGIDAGLIRIGDRAMVSRPAEGSSGQIHHPTAQDAPAESGRRTPTHSADVLVAGQNQPFCNPYLSLSPLGPII